jgi:hypothetical protein
MFLNGIPGGGPLAGIISFLAVVGTIALFVLGFFLGMIVTMGG